MLHSRDMLNAEQIKVLKDDNEFMDLFEDALQTELMLKDGVELGAVEGEIVLYASINPKTTLFEVLLKTVHGHIEYLFDGSYNKLIANSKSKILDIESRREISFDDASSVDQFQEQICPIFERIQIANEQTAKDTELVIIESWVKTLRSHQDNLDQLLDGLPYSSALSLAADLKN